MADFEINRYDQAYCNLVGANCLKVGDLVVVKSSKAESGKQICKITEMRTSRAGKHGTAKVHVVGYNIFSGRKCEDIFRSTVATHVPVLLKNEYLLLQINEDGFKTLELQDVNSEGLLRTDLRLNDNLELHREIEEAYNKGDLLVIMVTSVPIIGEEHISGYRDFDSPSATFRTIADITVKAKDKVENLSSSTSTTTSGLKATEEVPNLLDLNQDIKKALDQALNKIGCSEIQIRTLEERAESYRLELEWLRLRLNNGSEDSCAVCWDADINSVFINCGHSSCCFLCASKLNKCPVCRKNVITVMKIFRT